MNSGIPQTMQALRPLTNQRVSVVAISPKDVICARCTRQWSNHDPACKYANTPLSAPPDPDTTRRATAYQWMHRCALAAAELLNEAELAALDELTPMERAPLLRYLTAARDNAADLGRRLSCRLASTQSPGGHSE